MKIIILLIFISMVISANPISKDCTMKGRKLSGRVKIVKYAADFRVTIKDYAADINVWVTNGSLRNCGEWKFVENGEDFRIEFVEYAPDFNIKFVDSVPGLQ